MTKRYKNQINHHGRCVIGMLNVLFATPSRADSLGYIIWNWRHVYNLADSNADSLYKASLEKVPSRSLSGPAGLRSVSS